MAILLGRSQWLQHNGISALTLAIVLGIPVGNTPVPRIAAGSAAGVGFSKQILLRAGIILYGLRLTFQDIAGVGLHGVLLDALMLASTFGLACLLGTRLFGLDRTTTSADRRRQFDLRRRRGDGHRAGRGRAEQVAVAVSTVVVFGTLGIFPIRRCSSSTRTGAATARPWPLGRAHRCHGARGGPGGRRGSLDRHRRQRIPQ